MLMPMPMPWRLLLWRRGLPMLPLLLLVPARPPPPPPLTVPIGTAQSSWDLVVGGSLGRVPMSRVDETYPW